MHVTYADLRCGLAFFATASLPAFLPSIGISISFCAFAVFRGFLEDFAGSAPTILRRRASMAILATAGEASPPSDKSSQKFLVNRIGRRVIMCMLLIEALALVWGLLDR